MITRYLRPSGDHCRGFLPIERDQVWPGDSSKPPPELAENNLQLVPYQRMALKVPRANNVQLFKEGYKYLQGIDEAVLRNIQAVVELSDLVRTSFGPNGTVHLRWTRNDALTRRPLLTVDLRQE